MGMKEKQTRTLKKKGWILRIGVIRYLTYMNPDATGLAL